MCKQSNMVEVRVQTMYREMETQTYPWSPPFIKISQNDPEILLLNHLKWGDGLPAGRHEVEGISRNRKKRAWEIYLTSVQKCAPMSFKKKVISQIERSDWEFLEQDLETVNEQRMELARIILDEQRVDFISKLAMKIDRTHQYNIKKIEEKVIKIEHEKDKELRRIKSMTKKKFTEKYEKKTIIDSYSDKMSDLYAFRVKLGYHRKNKSIVLCKDAYNMIKDNKKKIRKFMPPNRAGKTKKHNCLKEQFINATESELDDYFTKFSGSLTGEESVTKQRDLKDDLVKREDILHFADKIEERQRIEEEVLIPVEEREDSEIMEMKQQRLLEKYRQSCLQHHEKESLQMHTGGVESSLLGKLLDLTSKERQRLEEERKILAIALIAQAERWRREAREAGNRQKKHMREMIKKRILDQAFDKIGEDLQNQFKTVFRDSLLTSAVVDVEENMRIKLYNIDRSSIPKSDEGEELESNILQISDHIQKHFGGENNKSLLYHMDGSMSDLGEITNAVNDLYDEVISTTLDLDEFIITLNKSDIRESQCSKIEEKLHLLVSSREVLPNLEAVKNDMLDIYMDYTRKRENKCDIKKMNKLCDTVIELADELYEIIIGDEDITSILEDMNKYEDAIVDDQLITYLNNANNKYIFKILKISHILNKKNPDKNYLDINDKIKKSAIKLCSAVSKIAIIMNDLLFKEGTETSGRAEESDTGPESQIKDSKIVNHRIQKLCEKLLDNKKEKKTQTTTDKLETDSTVSSSKIDVCKIKMEAAMMIESIVEVWQAIDSMLAQIVTTKNIDELQAFIINTLKCAMKILEEQFGDMEGFPGFHSLLNTIDPLSCDDFLMKFQFLKNPPEIIVQKANKIVEPILNAAITICSWKKYAPLDLTLEKLVVLKEPLKSDVFEMANKPNKYKGIQKITNKKVNSSLDTLE